MLLTLPGCKRKQDNGGSAGGLLSPAAGEVSAEDVEEVLESPEEDEVLRALGPAKFENEEPDAGAAPFRTRAAAQAAQDEEEEARRAAEEKARKELTDTEKAVNAALNKVLPQLRRCYERGGSGASSSTVSLRVHRQGYIINSSVDGASSAVNGCIQELLGNVRVQGVKTDTITVKRKFSFR